MRVQLFRMRRRSEDIRITIIRRIIIAITIITTHTTPHPTVKSISIMKVRCDGNVRGRSVISALSSERPAPETWSLSFIPFESLLGSP